MRRRPPQPPPFEMPKELPPPSWTGNVVVMHTLTGLFEIKPASEVFGKRRTKKEPKDK